MPTLFPTECKIFPAANGTLDFAFNTLKSKIGLLCLLVQNGCSFVNCASERDARTEELSASTPSL